jgi:hypothetical protein
MRSGERGDRRLWLGLLTVLEWGKDLDEPVGDALPAFRRDTTQVYLVTSRDGVSIDTSSVYAQTPLLPKTQLKQVCTQQNA